MHKLRREQLGRFWDIENKQHFVRNISKWNLETLSKMWQEKIYNYIEYKVRTLSIEELRSREYMLKSMNWILFNEKASFATNIFSIIINNLLIPDYIWDMEDEEAFRELDEIVERSLARNKMVLKRDDFFRIAVWSEVMFISEMQYFWWIIPKVFHVWWKFWDVMLTFNEDLWLYELQVPLRLIQANTIFDDQQDEASWTKVRNVPKKTEILNQDKISEELVVLFWKPKKWEFVIEWWDFDWLWIKPIKMVDSTNRYWKDPNDSYLVLKITNLDLHYNLSDEDTINEFTRLLDFSNALINHLWKTFWHWNWKNFYAYSPFTVIYNEKADETSSEALQEKFQHLLVKVKTPVYFSEIWWQDKAKEELMDLVNALKHEHIIKAWATKPPSWIIFDGPPGTWKTLLAVALASEINAEVYKIKLTDIMNSIYVNSWAKNVAELFTFLRSRTKAGKKKVVVILDELDALFWKRWWWDGWSKEDDKVVNMFLTEMNWFEDDDNIIFIGTTNNIEAIDPAVLRSWRMTSKIKVWLPDAKWRKEIFDVHIKKTKKQWSRNLFAEDIDVMQAVSKTEKFSWADIEEVIRKALYSMAKKEIAWVPKADLVVDTSILLNAIEEVKKTAWIKTWWMWFKMGWNNAS